MLQKSQKFRRKYTREYASWQNSDNIYKEYYFSQEQHIKKSQSGRLKIRPKQTFLKTSKNGVFVAK